MTKEKMFVLENTGFVFDDYVLKPITETGSWSDSWEKWNINLSGIFTYLIHRVGRYTEFYASDLLYTWDEVKTALKNPEIGSKTILVGVRYYGVDSNDQIASKLRNGYNLNHEYIDGIYMIQIEQDQDDDKITVTFGKTSFH